jgi:hypothetical protein
MRLRSRYAIAVHDRHRGLVMFTAPCRASFEARLILPSGFSLRTVIGALMNVRIDPGSPAGGRRGWLPIFGALSLISVLITPCSGFAAGTTAAPQTLHAWPHAGVATVRIKE